MHRLRTLITLLSFVCFVVSPASAQNSFPSKPITMLVPFGAGGALDLIARVLADGLRNELGQTILVDNKPGASGLLAMRLAAVRLSGFDEIVDAPIAAHRSDVGALAH